MSCQQSSRMDTSKRCRARLAAPCETRRPPMPFEPSTGGPSSLSTLTAPDASQDRLEPDWHRRDEPVTAIFKSRRTTPLLTLVTSGRTWDRPRAEFLGL